MEDPPSPPHSTPSVSPKLQSQPLQGDEHDDPDDRRPVKKQRTDTPPLTPPCYSSPPLATASSSTVSGTASTTTAGTATTFSPSTSPAPSSCPSPPPLGKPVASFNSLPFDIQVRIVRDAATRSQPAFEKVNYARHYAPGNIDCRLLNPNLEILLRFRQWLHSWCFVSKTFYKIVSPMLTEHCVVTSMDGLCSLAGSLYMGWDEAREVRPEFKGKDKHVEKPPLPPLVEMFRMEHPRYLPPPEFPRRERIKERESRRVKDLVLWMAHLPSETSSVKEETRWPKWYLQDWMRYELAELGVERLVILASHGAAAANALLATIPNCKTITHLRVEVVHSSAIWSQDLRFYHAYMHQPETDHLCPRLSLHAPHLHSLALRNIHVCTELVYSPWQRLQVLDVSFVNALPGLCYTMDTTSSRYWDSAELSDYYHWNFNAANHLRQTLIWFLDTYPKCYLSATLCTEAIDETTFVPHSQIWPLTFRDNRGFWVARSEVWDLVVRGGYQPPTFAQVEEEEEECEDEDETDYSGFDEGEEDVEPPKPRVLKIQ